MDDLAGTVLAHLHANDELTPEQLAAGERGDAEAVEVDYPDDVA